MKPISGSIVALVTPFNADGSVDLIRLPRRIAPVVYMLLPALHTLLFDVFYIPAYVLFAGIPWNRIGLTLISGLTFNIIPAIGNFVLGILILPIATLLRKLDKKT